MAVRPDPEGYHTLTPQVRVRGAAEATDHPCASGAVDSIPMRNDEFPE